MKLEGAKEELIFRLGRDHRLAHQTLFGHRHPDETPAFHYEIIDDLHGPSRRVLELAFRGAAKSTIAEEYIAIDACYERFRNFIIVGESATRAVERLSAIKHEIDFNEHINTLFGSLHGSTWNEDKIVLTNGVVIQAFGRGQSLRGTKHDDVRPDGCLIDDIEDEESVGSPDQRDKTQRWLMRTLLPAMAPDARVRMLANMLDPDCLAVRLKKTGLWTVREYPWEYIDKDGERKATWPARFPLVYIDKTKAEYQAAGLLNEYNQEYMVEATDPSTRVFTSGLIKITGRNRTWEPTYAMYDPARTVKSSSAHTGKVVFSWIGNKLVVWEGDGQLWMPDKIISDMFDVFDQYQPVNIGIEKEGLEEFIMQPLRTEQTKRAQILPVKPMPAPVGKIQFIKSLQPFFVAGDVEFAKDLPVLREQLLSFPTGRMDVPNALAYALRMRPGLPIYDNFGFKNVVDGQRILRGTTCYIALGATRQYTTAVMVQIAGGALLIQADWIKEGDPGSVLGEIIKDAHMLATQQEFKFFAGKQHWQGYDTIGLQAACARNKVKISVGGDEAMGREDIRGRIDKTVHQLPALRVSTAAKWSINGFAGGYARSVVKGKELVGVADEGMYATLMQGLEAFTAISAGALTRDGDDVPNYAMDSSGRRYVSARPAHHGRG